MSEDDEHYASHSVTSDDLKGILMAARISPKAKPGSLLKGERKPGAKREREPDYLAQVRRCPCLACDNDPAGEAAHLRMANSGSQKPITGIGIRPDDSWALPLCNECHMEQHAIGEETFWGVWNLGLNPFETASLLYYARKDGIEAMRAVIFAAREKRK